MQEFDLNLLPAIHALLEEENVTRAAQRLHLSVPAASRALARSRRVFADPLLVRQGRGVVRTPQADSLLARLGPLMSEINSITNHDNAFNPASLRRTFVIRANEAVIAALGSPLLALVSADAPHVELRFELESANDVDALRSGVCALAIGSYGDLRNDLDSESIGEEHLVGILREGHPAAVKTMTVHTFAALEHVVVSRHGRATGPVDTRLRELGLSRKISAVVPSFSAALAMAAQSNLTTVVPSRLASALGGRTVRYVPPIAADPIDIQQIWHARHTCDPEHGWLRRCVATAASTLEASADQQH